jgi:hypothetical protein
MPVNTRSVRNGTGTSPSTYKLEPHGEPDKMPSVKGLAGKFG